jgi:hypothetical protein
VVELSTEIRAMDKEMRIFCSEMLVKIVSSVPTATVIQMMQKESMFEQKFVQIGLPGQSNISKTKSSTA